MNPANRRIVLGVEIEAYTILVPSYRISRRMAFPRKGVREQGERFARDWSIGTEYNSRPFSTIREGLFLLKAGLRKYSQKLYQTRYPKRTSQQLLLVGGWRDRFAGAHLHLSLADRPLTKDTAKRLAWHLHDHIPFLIAIGANSPVWADEITELATTRVTRASRTYFRPIDKTTLTQRQYDEMLYSKGRKLKPATLEIRVLDANIPEFVITAAAMVKVVALNWLLRGRASNRITKADYLKSRQDAARRGMQARLCWNGDWVTVPRYLDLLLWTHRRELEMVDIPEEVCDTLKLLKRRLNGAEILRRAALKAHEAHPLSWQQHFARMYVEALDLLLGGNSLPDFIDFLQVDVPDLDEIWIGRRNWMPC